MIDTTIIVVFQKALFTIFGNNLLHDDDDDEDDEWKNEFLEKFCSSFNEWHFSF